MSVTLWGQALPWGKNKLILRQTLEKPINGFWDGGAKSVFDWELSETPKMDSEGLFIKVGSYGANHWFHVAVGKTEKQTLGYAKRRFAKRGNCRFEYVQKYDI